MNFLQNFIHHHAELLRQKGISNPENTYAHFLTPGFQASSHVIAFIFEPGKDTPNWVAKWPRLDNDHARLDIEYGNLTFLNQLTHTQPGGIPKVLIYKSFNDTRVLIETLVPGKILRQQDARKKPDEMLKIGRNWLLAFHQTTQRSTAELPGWFQKSIEERIKAIITYMPLTREEQIALEKHSFYADKLRSTLPHVVFEHGDFSAPNLLLDHGKLSVVDWELGDPLGLPAGDFIFFLTFLTFARFKTKTLSQQLDAFGKAFIKPGWAMPHLKRYANDANLTMTHLKYIFAATWTRYLGNMILRLAADQTKLSNQKIDWLRNNRYYHIWMLAANALEDLKWE
jgi:hypothetical protein